MLLGASITLLRLNAVDWYGDFDAKSMVAEIETIGDQAPADFCWDKVGPGDFPGKSAIEPDWAAESVLSWVSERAHGWSDLRPPWSRPGWLAASSSWMLEQLSGAGYVAPRAPGIHHLWGISVVLAADSDSGTAYLKCSSDRFRREAEVTQALAARSPLLLPEVIAVDPGRGWLLMRDLESRELGDQPESAWWLGIDALAELQLSWLNRADELLALGVEERSLTALGEWVRRSAVNDDLLRQLDSDARAEWLASIPEMVDACLRLKELGPGQSLVHGDFHPWNVVASNRSSRIFDWTDACVAHPFLDLVTYVMRSHDMQLRAQLVDRYFAHWSSYISEGDLREAGRLAPVVGALHQAHTYAQLIPTVMPDDLGALKGGDATWLLRALRRKSHGWGGQY